MVTWVILETEGDVTLENVGGDVTLETGVGGGHTGDWKGWEFTLETERRGHTGGWVGSNLTPISSATCFATLYYLKVNTSIHHYD